MHKSTAVLRLLEYHDPRQDADRRARTLIDSDCAALHIYGLPRLVEFDVHDIRERIDVILRCIEKNKAPPVSPHAIMVVTEGIRRVKQYRSILAILDVDGSCGAYRPTEYDPCTSLRTDEEKVTLKVVS